MRKKQMKQQKNMYTSLFYSHINQERVKPFDYQTNTLGRSQGLTPSTSLFCMVLTISFWIILLAHTLKWMVQLVTYDSFGLDDYRTYSSSANSCLIIKFSVIKRDCLFKKKINNTLLIKITHICISKLILSG